MFENYFLEQFYVMLDNYKFILYFLFLRIKNMMFLNNIF